jgi:hypothetical protein
MLPTVCYSVVMPQVVAPDAPDLLSATKIFPKTVVDDDPEDPIFWSTCFERVEDSKEWLPPIGDAGPEIIAAEVAPEYSFVGSKEGENYCLDCHSLKHNSGEFDYYHFNTPRWWLQPKGQCTACDVTFNHTTQPSWMSDPPATKCPAAFPWAYRPDRNFDHCCKSPNTRNAAGFRDGTLFGPLAKRGESCFLNEFSSCSAPPCKDFSVGYRLGVEGLTTCPFEMPAANLHECVQAYEALKPTGGPNSTFSEVKDLHYPYGCSMSYGAGSDDQQVSVRFNRQPTTINNYHRGGGWALVCHKSYDDKGLLPTPKVALHRVSTCDQCGRQTNGADLCDETRYQRDDLLVASGGTRGGYGIVGAPLSDVGCEVLLPWTTNGTSNTTGEDPTAYAVWHSSGTGGVYVTVPATVTLHSVSACDQCANHTQQDICQGYEQDTIHVGTGGANGRVGPTLVEVGCSVLDSRHRIWRNSEGPIYIAVASAAPATTTTTASTTTATNTTATTSFRVAAVNGTSAGESAFSTTTEQLTTTANPPSNGTGSSALDGERLGAGGIVGIVVLVIALLAGVVAGGAYAVKNRKGGKYGTSRFSAAATTVNAAFSNSQHSAITVADTNKNPTESSTATDYAELLARTNGDVHS